MDPVVTAPNDANDPLAPLLWRYVAATEDIALFMLDDAGRVIAWNVGAERVTGFAEQELRGRTLAPLYPSEDVAAGVPARELELAASNGRLTFVGERLRKGGGSFRARTVLAPIRNVADVLGFVGTISAPRADREAAAPAGPDRRVHDINNLLTVILGNAEALGQRLAGHPELRQFSDRIAEAADRGAALLRSLFPRGAP